MVPGQSDRTGIKQEVQSKVSMVTLHIFTGIRLVKRKGAGVNFPRGLVHGFRGDIEV